MPAIQLTRLRKQVDELLTHLDKPDAFWQAYAELLDFYTNRTARALPNPGDYLTTLHAPLPLLREIERQLAPQAATNPQRILPVILRLWKEPLFEAHWLAARLLTHIPTGMPNWFDILQAWLLTTRDPRIRSALLTDTLRPLRQQQPERFLRMLRSWLSGESPTPSWNYALTALTPYLQEVKNDALPPVFDLLHNVLPAITPLIQNNLAAILQQLYEKSPAETRFFLRETMKKVRNPIARRTLRRMSNTLPDDLRVIIRQAVADSTRNESPKEAS